MSISLANIKTSAAAEPVRMPPPGEAPSPAEIAAQIDSAVLMLVKAKRDENTAKAQRLVAEALLVKLVGHKEEGAHSHSTALFKVTTTGSLTRSVDAEALAAIKAEIPEHVYESVFKFKPDVALTALREVQEKNPDLYAVIAQCLTIKPAKFH
jgi:hypothetical protein